MRLNAAIKGIRTHLPEQKLTNEDLAAQYGVWDAAKILQKTGIATRHIAAPGECASDLAIAAAEKLFADGVVSREEIDFVLFCTQSPDHFLPASACLIQDRLGLRTECGAMDMNQGCSGFIYGLSVAKGLVESEIARNVLILTGETYSKHMHPGDRSARTIFSDGASATWVATVDGESEHIGPFVLGTDGSGAKNLIVPAGAFRNPVTEESCREEEDESGNVRTLCNLYMNGGEVFTFTLRTIPCLLQQLLRRACIKLEDVDYFVFHQANRFMLEQLRKKLGIPCEKFCINLEHYGNTVSATIPMALELALQQGEVETGDRIMAVGFGVGYSWGACLVTLI